MSETLSERELRALMAVVEEGRRDEPTEGLPWAVLDELARLIACDAVSFCETDRAGRRGLIDQTTEEGQHWFEPVVEQSAPSSFWNNIADFLPLRPPGRVDDRAQVGLWSDFYTRTELRNTPLYAEYSDPSDAATTSACSSRPHPATSAGQHLPRPRHRLHRTRPTGPPTPPTTPLISARMCSWSSRLSHPRH